MKELSIEEKARAYDRVSKEVKDFFEGKQKMYSDVEQTLEYLFPDLKESEDEKAMKDLLNFLKSPFVKEHICDWKVAPWIAWLEKQDEQKPTWNKEDETYLDYIITAVKLCYPDDKDKENPWRNELLGWLKSLRTRVGYVDKWKPSEEQMKVLSYYADQNDSRGFVITSLLDDLKKLKNK